MRARLLREIEAERHDGISARTRAALADLLATGVRLGAPQHLPVAIRKYLLEQHEENGRGWSDLAREMNDNGIPTPTAVGKWHPATVLRAVRSARLDREAERKRASPRL